MEKVSFPILAFLLLQKMLLKYFNVIKILFAVCVCTICLLLKQTPQILEDKYIGTALPRFRSGWEAKAFIALDKNPKIISDS